MKETKFKQNLNNLRHSCSHLLAAAVVKLWPSAKLTIGPPIDDGFYYDFDFGKMKISESDLPNIEKQMSKIVYSWNEFKRIEVSKEEAKKQFSNNPYKLELIEEFSQEAQKLTIFKSGEFKDLCHGGHVEHPNKKLKHFKLLSVAGAYWKGNEKNKMLTRIYGTAFFSQEELDNYLWQQEEAKKRDHRLIGKNLDIFVIDENIGKGLPLLTPKGTTIRKQILDYEYELETKAGFMHVVTPHIARSEIYKKTGHWKHYREYMYQSFGIEGEEYVLKPMNCPHHYMIYSSRPRSYKELPVRFAEAGTCYRYEKSGELTGLIRVRSLTIDDSHIIMRHNQIEQEYKICMDMVDFMFKAFHIKDYFVRVSLADPLDAIKYIADNKTWEKASDQLIRIVKKSKLKYEIEKGEASFYGPKLDYMVRDSLGRQWQMSTLQLDLFMAKRLNLTYIDHKGNQKHPIILHRGLTGSLERTIGILIEHYAGAFPLWLSPVQIIIIPISQRHLAIAQKHKHILSKKNIRAEIDERNETVEAKIRDATLQKVPFMGIIGDREKSNLLSVRTRKGDDLGQIKINNFIDKLTEEIEKKKR